MELAANKVRFFRIKVAITVGRIPIATVAVTLKQAQRDERVEEVPRAARRNTDLCLKNREAEGSLCKRPKNSKLHSAH